MAEISLCMIVKNEEKNLAYCLDCVADIVDEINIIDTGSTDNTVEISKKYTDRVFYFKWNDNFADARNFSYSKATKDFIMWLDADDILTEENRKRLLGIKNILDDNIDFIIAQYRTHYDENGAVSLIFPKIRITRRAMGLQWRGAVHEDLEGRGNALTAELYIDHNFKDPGPSLKRDLLILKNEIDSGRATPHIHYFYGLMQYSLGYFDEAEHHFNIVIDSEQSIAFDPIELYIAMHNIYKIRGDLDKARSILEDNESLMADKAEFYCCLGIFYQDCLQDLQTACDKYKQALRTQGTFLSKLVPGQRKPIFYYYIPCGLLGKAYLRLREPESAFVYFQHALTYKKDNEVEQIVEKLKRIIELKRSANMVTV